MGAGELHAGSLGGHADFSSSGEVGLVDRIERGVELQGDLDSGQRQGLLEIANRYPVHRTLESEVSIATHVVGGTGTRDDDPASPS